MKIHKDVISCDISTTIVEVAKMVRDKDVRHIYVVDEGKLVGVLAGIDIIIHVVAEEKDYAALTAKDVMEKDVKSVTEDQEDAYAYVIMRNFNTFTCPVVDADGKLVGYVKFAEVCKDIDDKMQCVLPTEG
ncbi:MAG: CBS domain-containing protein [archaeon]